MLSDTWVSPLQSRLHPCVLCKDGSRRYGSWGTLYNNTAGKTAALQGGPPATSMIELGPATENDMVLEFLRAEVDSPRFGLAYSGSWISSERT